MLAGEGICCIPDLHCYKKQKTGQLLQGIWFFKKYFMGHLVAKWVAHSSGMLLICDLAQVREIILTWDDNSNGSPVSLSPIISGT